MKVWSVSTHYYGEDLIQIFFEFQGKEYFAYLNASNEIVRIETSPPRPMQGPWVKVIKTKYGQKFAELATELRANGGLFLERFPA